MTACTGVSAVALQQASLPLCLSLSPNSPRHSVDSPSDGPQCTAQRAQRSLPFRPLSCCFGLQLAEPALAPGGPSPHFTHSHPRPWPWPSSPGLATAVTCRAASFTSFKTCLRRLPAQASYPDGRTVPAVHLSPGSSDTLCLIFFFLSLVML